MRNCIILLKATQTFWGPWRQSPKLFHKQTQSELSTEPPLRAGQRLQQAKCQLRVLDGPCTAPLFLAWEPLRFRASNFNGNHTCQEDL